jgi:hypothetical protein
MDSYVVEYVVPFHDVTGALYQVVQLSNFRLVSEARFELAIVVAQSGSIGKPSFVATATYGSSLRIAKYTRLRCGFMPSTRRKVRYSRFPDRRFQPEARPT